MDCPLQEGPRSPWGARTVLLADVRTAIVTILDLLGNLALSGCNNYSAGVASVSGKLTLGGKPWPKDGRIYFTNSAL